MPSVQDWQQKCSELEAEEARHAMKLQAQLMHVHLANQAADLQRRLLWDAANYNQQQQQAQQQPGDMMTSTSQGDASGASHGSPGSPLRFSPNTWQMEVMPVGQPPSMTRSGELAAAYAAMPLPSSDSPSPALFMSPIRSGGGSYLVPSPTSD